MIPYNILFKLGSKAVGTFMTRRKQKSDRAHSIALQEMATGNERAKRNGSLFLDLLLGAFILTPLAILAYGSYLGNELICMHEQNYFLIDWKIYLTYIFI